MDGNEEYRDAASDDDDSSTDEDPDTEESGDGDGDIADASAGGGDGCQLGAAGSFATDQKLDLFGNIIYFAAGQTLPKGRYRVSFEDGCMKYNFIFGWSVNSKPGDGWWLVSDTSSDRVTVLPGQSGMYPDFAGCVSANRATEPKEFDFEGGKLGIWLNDVPYQDNLAGEGGVNPKWKLTLLEKECPPELILL